MEIAEIKKRMESGINTINIPCSTKGCKISFKGPFVVLEDYWYSDDGDQNMENQHWKAMVPKKLGIEVIIEELAKKGSACLELPACKIHYYHLEQRSEAGRPWIEYDGDYWGSVKIITSLKEDDLNLSIKFSQPRTRDDVHERGHWRWHPLLDIWILNSPNRLERAWSGDREITKTKLPEYDPNCPFCPGNPRVSGEKNPINPDAYPFAFTNDCPVLQPFERDEDCPPSFSNEMFQAKPVFGMCRMVNFHPKHNLVFALMSEKECLRVIKLWQEEYKQLGELPYISTVNIFENNRFGSSQPHPHNQIWCSSEISPYLSQILQALRRYKEQNKVCLFCRTVEKEISGYKNKRVIYQNSDFVAFVPYWAIWPFEIWIVAKAHRKSLLELSEKELENLAFAYRIVNAKLDNLFKAICPYSSGIYQAPTDGQEHLESHFHVIFRSPVVRSVDVWKWMVGYEFMAQPQRDISPEEAAEFLKETPDLHY